MAAAKELEFTSLTVELEGGYTDDAKLIKLRRTLSNVSSDVTPAQAIETVQKLFALQKYPVMAMGQQDTFSLYQ